MKRNEGGENNNQKLVRVSLTCKVHQLQYTILINSGLSGKSMTFAIHKAKNF